MTARRTLSVRARLILFSSSLIALALLVFAGAVRLSVARVLLSSLENALRHQADAVSQRGGPDDGRRGPGPPENRPGFAGRPDPNRPGEPNRPFGFPRGPGPGPPVRRMLPPREVDLGGNSRFGGTPALWSPGGFARARGGEANFARTRAGDEEIYVYSRPIRDAGRISGVLQTAAPLSEIDAALAGLTTALTLLLPIAVLLAAVLGAALTDRILQPVRVLTDAAARIEADHLDARLPADADDEFGRLGAMLNRMLGRLSDAFERQKRFTADASHELRTPLAVIKTTAEIARENAERMSATERDEALATIEQSADRATRLVRDLLLLARGDRGTLTPRREPVALAPALDQIRRAAEASAPAPHAPIRVDVSPAELTVSTDPDHLARIVGNLLDNALRHTPADGGVLLQAAADGAGVRIAVVDTGEGIAPEHQKRLGEPFYRPDAARSRSTGGAGLGLAICQTLATALGASLAIDSAPGKGTTVALSLPAAGPD